MPLHQLHLQARKLTFPPLQRQRRPLTLPRQPQFGQEHFSPRVKHMHARAKALKRARKLCVSITRSFSALHATCPNFVHLARHLDTNFTLRSISENGNQRLR